MTVFADASAVVKVFANEVGSEAVRAEPDPFVLSVLTRVETASALWRKVRDGALRPSSAHLLVTAIHDQISAQCFAHGPSLYEVALDVSILESATYLCGIHAMRAGDAIQLATALAVREIDRSCDRFWVFDQRLAQAAATEGFMILGAA